MSLKRFEELLKALIWISLYCQGDERWISYYFLDIGMEQLTSRGFSSLVQVINLGRLGQCPFQKYLKLCCTSMHLCPGELLEKEAVVSSVQ